MIKTHPILIGRSRTGYWSFNSSEHVGLHARTGSGKTTGFTIPNCFAWPGSLVVLDVKGEAFNATSGYRAHVLGQDVYRFSPTASDGCSHCWNPLDVVDRGSDRRFDQIMRQANMLIEERPAEGSNASRFWEPAGRGAIAAVTALLAEQPNEPLTYDRLLTNLMRGDIATWLVRQINARRASNNPFSQRVVLGISDFLAGADDMVQSIRKTVTTNLQCFWNPLVTAATNRSDFNLAEIRRRPMTIYVAVAPSDIPRIRFLLRLLFDQVLNLNTDITPEQDPSLRVPVLLLLDEFAQLGPMFTLAHAAQFCRGYGIRLAYVIQDKAQLQALYGPAASRDIFSNIGVEIIFGTTDWDQARELENRMGDNTVQIATQSQPRFWSTFRWDRQTQSRHPHRRPVMLDQEILQMPDWMQLILRPGMKPMRSRRIHYHNDRQFLRHVHVPLPIPKLPINIDLDDGSVVIPLRQPITSGQRQTAKPAAATGQMSLLTPFPPLP